MCDVSIVSVVFIASAMYTLVHSVRNQSVVSVMSSASVVSLFCLGRGEPKEDTTKLKVVLFTVGGNGRSHHHPRNTNTINFEKRCP